MYVTSSAFHRKLKHVLLRLGAAIPSHQVNDAQQFQSPIVNVKRERVVQSLFSLASLRLSERNKT